MLSEPSSPSPAPDVRVLPLGTSDLAWAAGLHAEHLPSGFFAQLGPRFLRRYLATFLLSPVGVAVRVDVDGAPKGFLVGTSGPGHSGWALRRCWRTLLPAGVLGLLTHPRLLGVFLRTRTRRYVRAAVRATRPAPASEAPLAVRRAALLHIAVDPRSRGAGAGAALVDAFVAAARTAHCTDARLVTYDVAANGGFYARLGWEPVQERVDEQGRTATTLGRRL